MIDLRTEASRQARRLWADHIRRQMQELDLDDRLATVEISESLAVFCVQHPQLTNHTLSLLLARSFCATGDADAACRILKHDHRCRAYTETWLDALSAEYPFPELYPLFSSRILHPLHLATVRTPRSWELDLEKLALTPADRHEIILLQTLRMLVEKVSNVWKKSAGEGALAVKGLARISSFLQSRSDQNLPNYLRDVLCCCARNNGWPTAPSILLLDF